MPADPESNALVWRRFKRYHYSVPDALSHQSLLPINIRSPSKLMQTAKPIELLERRIMMSGIYLSDATIEIEPAR
jgi:hypothetical protein